MRLVPALAVHFISLLSRLSRTGGPESSASHACPQVLENSPWGGSCSCLFHMLHWRPGASGANSRQQASPLWASALTTPGAQRWWASEPQERVGLGWEGGSCSLDNAAWPRGSAEAPISPWKAVTTWPLIHQSLYINFWGPTEKGTGLGTDGRQRSGKLNSNKT